VQNQHVKNRARKLEAAHAKSTADAQRLYGIALHWHGQAFQLLEESKFLGGVAMLGLGFMAAIIGYFAVLHEVSK
jgi:hypothetical protein